MVFDWDERKNQANRAKHRVSFEAATLVFEDPHAVGVPDRVEEGEERWQTVGMAAGVVLLQVAHTYREKGGEEYIRIISARKATPQERKIYEEGF
jgi:uncharacterized DUF497 family protein